MSFVVIAPLFMIFVEDLLHREVRALWFVLVLVYGLYKVCCDHMAMEVCANAVMLTVMVSGLFGYWRIKTGAWDLIDRGFGIGDVVMLFCLIFFFRPDMYLIFIIVSSVCTIMLHLVLNYFNIDKRETLPLAGCQSILTMLLFITGEIT